MILLWLPFYEKRNGYLEEEVKKKLLDAKARTLDRVLGPARRKHGSRGQMSFVTLWGTVFTQPTTAVSITCIIPVFYFRGLTLAGLEEENGVIH